MTKKHAFIFFFYKIWLWLNGIKRGVFVKQIYEGKTFKGVITQVYGVSVTKSTLGVDINVQWFAPFQGNDFRYYSQGTYSFEDFKTKVINISKK